jgi:hypothetical protein
MRITSVLLPALLASFASAQTSTPVTPGNLVVLRIGDGLNPLTNASQAMFLDEYTTTGTLVQTIDLPIAANGANLPITSSGTATSEGNLQLDPNGQYFVFGGYDSVPGVASIAGTASASVPRVVGVLGMNGVVDTSTSTANAFSAGNIRSATTSNGVDFFAVGSNSGVQYLTLGATSSTGLNTGNPQNNRTVSIAGSQLYVSGSAQGFYGVSEVGTGVSTTPPLTITTLNGMPTAAGPSTYDFYFADPNTLYLADDRTTLGAGGIEKYTQSGGVWTLQYTLNPATTVGCRSLTGVNNGGVVTLFATNTLNSTNELLMVTDTGATSTFSSVAIAGTNTVFRGVRLASGTSTITRIQHGCGPTTISASGTGAMGTTVNFSLGNVTGVPFFGYGFSLTPAPLCSSCVIGHEWGVALYGATSNFSIPNASAYIGIAIGVQGADVFAVGGCAQPPLTLTDTMVVVIH